MPVGGKVVDVRLVKSYTFNWLRFGAFWFAEIEGAAIVSSDY